MPENWYRLLPFTFKKMVDGRYLCTSMAGDHVILSRETLANVVDGRMGRHDPASVKLLHGLFLATDPSLTEIDLIATRLRTAIQARSDLAALHIVVTTLRCANSCRYCQVTHASPQGSGKDMSLECADRVTDLIHSCISPSVKIEFQGGESLMNMPVVNRICERSERLKATSGKQVSYIVATSLNPLSDAHLEAFARYGIQISTSLDGPEELHNSNRPNAGGNGWRITMDGIRRCRERLGRDSVSALMTTTRRSLTCPEAIVDTYVENNFNSIFFRWLNPFGDALRNHADLHYSPIEWLSFWKSGLERILHHNRHGRSIREEFAATLLRRMLSPFPTGFVDLDSPTGSGMSVLVYNYDGNIYISDEARMLAETGDRTFLLGTVAMDSFSDLMSRPWFRETVSRTMLNTTPQCCDCACLPWCGVDPVLNYATQGDMVGYRPTSEFCKRMEGAFHHLARILEGPDRDVLLSWGQS